MHAPPRQALHRFKGFPRDGVREKPQTTAGAALARVGRGLGLDGTIPQQQQAHLPVATQHIIKPPPLQLPPSPQATWDKKKKYKEKKIGRSEGVRTRLDNIFSIEQNKAFTRSRGLSYSQQRPVLLHPPLRERSRPVRAAVVEACPLFLCVTPHH